MIKNIRRFLAETALERKRYLKELTYRKSARTLEKMLSSRIFSYMHFSDDDNPIALYKLVTRAR